MIKSLMDQIREINRKYATPEIEMTPFVKWCLLGLRVYLLLLVLLMIIKFIIAARS
jgi:flagellar biosynthesis/type III secretory pathway M-ring protein FliF/YscJ